MGSSAEADSSVSEPTPAPAPATGSSASAALFDAKESPTPAIENSSADTAVREDGSQTIVVDGNPIKMDKLGPVVVNTDGSLSRINNWHEMIESEQQKTLRIIGKRNQQRLAKLREAAAGDTA